jgi:hypothetical protein
MDSTKFLTLTASELMAIPDSDLPDQYLDLQQNLSGQFWNFQRQTTEIFLVHFFDSINILSLKQDDQEKRVMNILKIMLLDKKNVSVLFRFTKLEATKCNIFL